MKHVLFIPRWHPTTVNQLLRLHYMVANIHKKSDRQLIAHYAREERIPRAKGKRRVETLIILKKGQRAADVDAYHKSLLDGLKHTGMIIDDNRQNCEIAPVAFERGTAESWGTQIVLEDL